MIHLVCDCGALVSAAPLAGVRTLPCRSCGKGMEVPDAGFLGIEPQPPAPVAVASSRAPAAPPPAAAAAAAAPEVQPPAFPIFGADERLDLRVLEREAARLLVMGRLSLAAGLLGAGSASLLPGWSTAGQTVVAAASLFAATAAWTGFRAARATCLAAVALAQRQREILRSVARS